MSNPAPRDYGNLLGDIKERIRSAQYAALRAVNKELIGLYWDIGRIIVERQSKAGWGRAVVERLAEDLQAEFPGIKGFSASNLWRMRLFYEAYTENEFLAPLVREIAWAQQFYLSVLDDRVRQEDENLSIGIILCRSKDRTIVEYALRDSQKAIGVAAYRMVSDLPEDLRGQLPAPEQVALLMRESQAGDVRGF